MCTGSGGDEVSRDKYQVAPPTAAAAMSAPQSHGDDQTSPFVSAGKTGRDSALPPVVPADKSPAPVGTADAGGGVRAGAAAGAAV